jgi:ATP-dependent helicase HepA
MLTIDEAHQVASFAWSTDESERELFASYAKFSDLAEVLLLLSGTPLNGNEHNFLAMLHCISPQAYELNDDGIEQFAKRVQERERLGGLYGAITPSTPNPVLEGILDELADLFLSDNVLKEMIERLRPLVDFFAPQDSYERDTEILDLRRYIGEHYRLHHRLLRNRRENSDLEILFPGLDGLSKHHWSVSLQDITLDEAIDDLRVRALIDPDFFQCIACDGVLPWVDDLLTSPLCVEQRAMDLFERYGNEMSEQEREFLNYLVEIAKKEQYQKDQLLTQVLKNWLNANPNGKTVVFCTRHEIAQFVGEQLQNEITGGVVFNWDKEVKLFNSPENEIPILVCDQGGEDGLNFNGGSRLAVHYSIPRDISRIEQRLGRFNRYSANLKGVKPVQSVVLLPETLGISGHWVDLLNDVMQIFNRTVASLQHMLEKQIDTTWTAYCQEGYVAFDKTEKVLSGDTGLIAVESKRVKAQEALMSMEEEVEEAFEFADQLEEADEIAEDQVQRMIGWITKALNFRLMGNPMETFRFMFMLDAPRTLVDVDSFLKTCLLGLDFNGGYPPVTMPMSASRIAVSDGKGLYPFRFGQPFLDTIWDLMQTDPRGTSMAILRSVPGQDYEEPEVYLRFTWLICAHEHDVNRIEQRIADEAFPPKIQTFWLRQDGQTVNDDETALLDAPYKNYATNDINLRSSLWSRLEEWFPSDQWERMILSLAEQAHSFCLDIFNEENITLHPQLIAVKAVVLCNFNLLSLEDDL